jgi:hypothetical protein
VTAEHDRTGAELGALAAVLAEIVSSPDPVTAAVAAAHQVPEDQVVTMLAASFVIHVLHDGLGVAVRAQRVADLIRIHESWSLPASEDRV